VVLLWPIVVLLLFDDDASPVVTEADGLALLLELDELLAPGPVAVWVVELFWSTSLAAALKPLFATASCRFRTDADWSTSFDALGPGSSLSLRLAADAAGPLAVADAVLS